MLFTYEKTEDAINNLYGLALENYFKSTQFFTRLFGDEWHCYDAGDIPPLDSPDMSTSDFGPLDACGMVAESDDGRQVIVRWDKEHIGGSVLHWESAPPENSAEEEAFVRLERAAAMTVKN